LSIEIPGEDCHSKHCMDKVHTFLKSSGKLAGASIDLCFSDLKLRRRESNKRLYFQPNDIAKGILRASFTDSVWIVSSIDFAVPNSLSDINP
jgi:hypothetical protein